MKRFEKFIFIFIGFGVAACSSAPSQTPAPIAITLPAPSITTISESTEPASETIPDIAQYGLAGRLILIQYEPGGNSLIELSLQSGVIKTLLSTPENSWLSEALVSPDGRQILLTYAPPPPTDEIQYGYSDLYLLPYDATSQPQPFLVHNDPQESFFFITWASDGQSIYFTHLYVVDPNSQVPVFQSDVEKVTLSGVKETIIKNALWPAMSPDGSKLAYLYVDPVMFSNDLYLANPDGSNQTPVLQPGVNPPVDAHLFTMDGNQLIFSMVNFQPAPPSSWLEKLFGVEVAFAHSVPSDWYRAPLSGGAPRRLTNLEDVNLNGDLSPDGSRLAFISATGLYVMNVDGSNLIQLSDDVLIGTVDWIP
jgi:Tol biopolymer transport system component